jgi:uncharacterized protein (DUF58 family)
MPDTNPIFDPTTLAKFGRLSLVARQVVAGFLSGIHKSPYKGFSVEFAEHRQYYPGDEIRHIDWRAFGKTDRYYIKEHEEETNLNAHLLVDASGSMAYRGAATSKFQYAQYVAASLAYLMLHQRDAVGMALHDERLRTLLPPRSTSKQLMQILATLEKATPGGETKMAPIWDRLANQFRARGMVVILSDCFDHLPSLVHALRHLRYRRHEVLLLHILAPEEIAFPFTGRSQFRHLETPTHQRLIEPDAVREQYLKNFGDFCRSLRIQASNLQIDYHVMRTDEPVDRALGVYLRKRLASRS